MEEFALGQSMAPSFSRGGSLKQETWSIDFDCHDRLEHKKERQTCSGVDDGAVVTFLDQRVQVFEAEILQLAKVVKLRVEVNDMSVVVSNIVNIQNLQINCHSMSDEDLVG
jgi:hypothetical protein